MHVAVTIDLRLFEPVVDHTLGHAEPSSHVGCSEAAIVRRAGWPELFATAQPADVSDGERLASGRRKARGIERGGDVLIRSIHLLAHDLNRANRRPTPTRPSDDQRLGRSGLP